MRIDINNGAPTKYTQLYSGLCMNPVLRPDGTKVAFVEADKVYSPTNITIMVEDINGGTPIDLQANIPTASANFFGDFYPVLDWPDGDWIYYANGSTFEGSNTNPYGGMDLYKINVNTKQKVLVFHLSPTLCDFAGWHTGSPSIQIMSVSGDVSKIIIRTFDDIQNPSIACSFWWALGADGSNIDLGTAIPGMYRSGSCGTSVTHSGNYISHWESTSHNNMRIETWNNQLVKNLPFGTIASWGKPFGLGADQRVMFSCNSDKWMCISVGWTGRCDGAGCGMGANQVIFNWQDSMMMLTTTVPQNDSSNVWWSCGDFWVNGGATAVGKMPLSANNHTDAFSKPAYAFCGNRLLKPGEQAWDLRGRRIGTMSKIPAVYITENTK